MHGFFLNVEKYFTNNIVLIIIIYDFFFVKYLVLVKYIIKNFMLEVL